MRQLGNFQVKKHNKTDTVVSGKKAALLTVIERKTRKGFIVRLSEKNSSELIGTLKN